MSGDRWASQRPSPHMQGKLVFSVTLSFFLSLKLFFSEVLCAVSHFGKVPFPSISGRLQSSVIREINGTGPISCLVPFESAKLLRTSKKMSQFIWDLIVPIVQNFKHMQPTPCIYPLTKTHTITVSWTSFRSPEEVWKYDTKHGQLEFSVMTSWFEKSF